MLSVVMSGGALLSPFTGIAQYTRSLALALREIGEVDLTFHYPLGYSRKLRSAPVPGIDASKRLVKAMLPFAYDAKRLVQMGTFRLGAIGRHFDLYHEPNFLPLPFDGPTVITAHDLSWHYYPETHPAERVRIMNREFARGLERSAHVITDAESVRREIVETFGLRPERITAVPLAARPVFRPMEAQEPAPTLATHGLAWRRFLLCVGTLEPRKNLEVALHAYAGLPASLQDRFPLIIVGMKGWLTSKLERLLAPLVASGRVRALGYVDDAALAALYASARMLVYPSLYEGFGLPPLEAMASGTPVVVSNVSSLPEVVGQAGLQVEPSDVDGLRHAVRLLAEDNECWEALRSAGLARAAQFSWDRCARETLAVYRKALA